MTISLRDYQQRSVDAVYRYFETQGGNPLVVVPTGGGKSVIIGALCRDILTRWPSQRILILSHVKELLEQNFSKITAFWPSAPAGLYCAALGVRRPRDPITVASIQSVHSKAHALGWRDLVFIDEAHLLSPDNDTMYRKLIDGLKQINPRLKVVGFTATPYRLKTGLLTEGKYRLFTDLAVEVTLTELLHAGHIAPLVSKSSVVQADLSGVGLVAGEFNHREAELALDKEALTAAALDEVQRLASDRRSWLFFCSGVKHAGHVCDALRARGISAASVTKDTPAGERDAILRALKSGELRAVTNAQVLTTGFDAPNIDLIVLLRATTSPGLYCQILGRGMRTHPDKANCLVLDFAGNIERHGPVTHVQPPRASVSRGQKQERVAPACLICPKCRMASPLDARECGECGHTFERPEAVKHATTASTLEVMPHLVRIAGHERLSVKEITYCIVGAHGGPEVLMTSYYTKEKAFPLKEYLCFRHHERVESAHSGNWKTLYPIPLARAWWNVRTVAAFPKSASSAREDSGSLAECSAIHVQKVNGYYQIRAYEIGGNIVPAPGVEGLVIESAPLAPPGADLGEWMDVDAVRYMRHEKAGKIASMRVEYTCGPLKVSEWICLAHPPGFALGKAKDWWRRRSDGATPPENIGTAVMTASSLLQPRRIRVRRVKQFWEVIGYDFDNGPAGEASAEDGGGVAA